MTLIQTWCILIRSPYQAHAVAYQLIEGFVLEQEARAAADAIREASSGGMVIVFKRSEEAPGDDFPED